MKTKLTLLYIICALAILSFARPETFPSLCKEANGGSLWKRRVATLNNLYYDSRARNIGDIVTVLISESTELKGAESTDTSKQTSVSSSTDMSNFLNFMRKNQTSLDLDNYVPNFETENSDAFEGEGNYSSTRGVDLKMTALITDVLPSGNLVVEGLRTVTINKETYNIRLFGVARPVDVMNSFNDSDGVFKNVIRSTSLANARITLEGKGFLTRAGKRGWAWRLRDIFWPF